MTDKPVFKITDKMFETLVEWQEETENVEFSLPPSESPNEPPKSEPDKNKDAASDP